ncbi:KICSTOR complex protein ITFG2-like [Haliotis asinina]|uniref:KICSTOR complex protein ITFG2-like n=1 Tax=Haliotis asinina TaxID=109174 RepID=UPI0035322CDF
MWRTVSFVERVEVEFSGNLLNQAMVLGDVDNDKYNELVVGNIDGDLSVFKGSSVTPWRKTSDLGMITCIGLGDICNKGKNNLVCLTAEGWCYIFDIRPEGSSEFLKEDESDVDIRILKPAYTQHLPANSKVMLIADTDGDGQTELVVGYSDRVVRTFRWQSGLDSDAYSTGQFIQHQKWQLAGQIGSITVNSCGEDKPQLLASQPGGTLVTLLQGTNIRIEQPHIEHSEESTQQSFVYHPLGSCRARNKEVSTVIVGGIKRERKEKDDKASSFYALATLDGSLVLVQSDKTESDKIVWSLQVDHQLFSLHKLDVTGNNREEVVCCSWDGQTYIVNHSREVVRYQFEENVAAFSAGFFALPDQGNVPCFVYATFNNRIYIYYNISLPEVESTNLLTVMGRRDDTRQLLARMNIDPKRTDQLRQLYHWVLYGFHGKT